MIAVPIVRFSGPLSLSAPPTNPSLAIQLCRYFYNYILYIITGTEDDVLKDDDLPDPAVAEGPKTITQ